MINIKKSFDKLFKSIEESSPNLKKTLREISPLTFFLNIKGHQDIYITINGENSYINFNENIYDFEIKASLIDLLKILATGKINKNIIFGNTEIAIVLFNALYKSDIDLIYLIDKYFGNLPAIFTYAIVKRLYSSNEVYQDVKHREIRKQLRDISIRIDRLEAFNSQ